MTSSVMMQVDPRTSPRGCVRKDTRTWAQRVHHLDDNWKPKIPLLVTAYLKYKRISSQRTDPATSTSNLGSDQPDTTETCTIGVLDIYSSDSTAVVAIAEGQTLAEALVTAGYLGTTPISPTLAISLKTLELFRCIRLFKASFSTEAFTKLLCHQYYVSVGLLLHCNLTDFFLRFHTAGTIGQRSLMRLTYTSPSGTRSISA